MEQAGAHFTGVAPTRTHNADIQLPMLQGLELARGIQRQELHTHLGMAEAKALQYVREHARGNG